MIVMSTEQFVGLITDVLPIAAKKGDCAVIRLDYDGHELSASATNRGQMCRKTYTTDDEDYSERAESEYVIYEIDQDTPNFALRAGLQDAQNMAKSFTLDPKLGWVPLAVAVQCVSAAENLYKLVVARSGTDSGEWSPLTLTIVVPGKPLPEANWQEIDIDAEIAKWWTRTGTAGEILLSPDYLANLAKATKTADELKLTFTGQTTPIRFTAGSRFYGLMWPRKPDKHDNDAVSNTNDMHLEVVKAIRSDDDVPF